MTNIEATTDFTVKELQDIIVGLGMPREDAEAIRTKAPLIASINVLRAKEAQTEVVAKEPTAAPVAEEKVKKVKSITEPKNPSEDRQVNKRWFGKAAIMRDKLMKQLEDDPVSIIIPLDDGEKRGVVEWRTDKEGQLFQVKISGDVATPQLNGFIFMIPKGVYYKVPRQIAEIIADSEQQTLEAGDHISMSRIDERTGRPIKEVML